MANPFRISIRKQLVILGLIVLGEILLIVSGYSPLTVTGTAPQPGAEAKLLGACFGIALLSVVVAGLIHELAAGTTKGLFVPAYGIPTWDPTSSWASNFTAVGAILGIILAQNVIPKTPTYFTKDQYVLLSFLFGGLIVFAPFFYNCFTTPVSSGGQNQNVEGQTHEQQQAAKDPNNDDPNSKGPDRCGYGLTFLIACLLTTWAVCGQLVLSWLLVAEFAQSSPAPLPSIHVLHVILALAVPLLAFYVLTTVPDMMEAQHQKQQRARVRAFYLDPEQEQVVVAHAPKTWALL